MMRCILTSVSVVMALSACASQQRLSYVGPLSDRDDAQDVADNVTTFLTAQFPVPATTTLVLEPPPQGQRQNTLTPILVRDLRQKGFAVAQGDRVSGAHTIRYWITPMDNTGEIVRLMLDDRTIASAYVPRGAAGKAQAGIRFTVLQDGIAG